MVRFINDLATTLEKDCAANIYLCVEERLKNAPERQIIELCEVDHVGICGNAFSLMFYSFARDMLYTDKLVVQAKLRDFCSLDVTFNSKQRSRTEYRGTHAKSAMCVVVNLCSRVTPLLQESSVHHLPQHQTYDPDVCDDIKKKYRGGFRPVPVPLKAAPKTRRHVVTAREYASTKLKNVGMFGRLRLWALGISDEADVLREGLPADADPDALLVDADEE